MKLLNAEIVVKTRNVFLILQRERLEQYLLQNIWIKRTRVFEIYHIQDGDCHTQSKHKITGPISTQTRALLCLQKSIICAAYNSLVIYVPQYQNDILIKQSKYRNMYNFLIIRHEVK